MKKKLEKLTLYRGGWVEKHPCREEFLVSHSYSCEQLISGV